MANFFRDTSMGFKPRSSIFSKLRVKDPINAKNGESPVGDLSLIDDSESSIIMDNANDDGLHGDDNSNKNNPNHDDSGYFSNGGNNDDTIQTSTDGTTPLAKNHNMSSPKKLKGNSNEGDEDDFEITEVRKVNFSTPKNSNIEDDNSQQFGDQDVLNTPVKIRKKNVPNISTLFHHEVSSSSNDVLLEAFTNTQRICSNLKQELHNQQSENSKLKSAIMNYQVDIKKINEKIVSYKKLLTSLDEKSNLLIKQKSEANHSLNFLKKNQQIYKQNINDYQRDISDLKITLKRVQESKNDLNSEVTKRDKEIEYLKREFDDCSGQLTEEKIKNNSLLKDLMNLKKEFINEIELLLQTKQSESFANLKTILDEKFLNLVDEDLKNQLSSTTELINTHIKEDYENLNETITCNTTSILSTCQDISTNLLDSRNDTSENISNLKKEMNRILEDLNHKTNENMSSNHTSLQRLLTDLSKSKDQSDSNLETKINEILHDIKEYQERLKKVNIYENEMKEYENQISSLQQQITENMSLIGSKEAQYEEKCHILEDQKAKLLQYTTNEERTQETINKLTNENEKIQAELVKVQEISKTEKNNFENKFNSQNGINNVLMSENDMLKQRVNELENYKEMYEKEQDARINKFQNINEQLQKLNVESVQLKAHELELEEENRNLKKMIDSNKANNDEYSCELVTLRQQLIEVNVERQKMISEKLDLQDKIDELQQGSKILRQKLNSMNEAREREMQSPQGRNMNKEEEQIIESVEQKQVLTQQPSKKSNKRSLSKRYEQTNSKKHDDEFDLSSSSNDDLELTNPSPICVKPLKSKMKNGIKMKNSVSSSVRKKLLLLDESEPDIVNHNQSHDNTKNTNKHKRRKNMKI